MFLQLFKSLVRPHLEYGSVIFSPTLTKIKFDGDIPQRPSYGIYISQLIRFARASSHVTDFNNRNKFLTAKLLGKAIGIINSAKHFPNFIVGTLN